MRSGHAKTSSSRKGRSDPFASRAASYALANREAPHARAAERDRLLAPLRLMPGQRILDLQAAGGFVAEGVRDRLKEGASIISIEPSAALVRTLPEHDRPIQAALGCLPLRSNSIDLVLCLAGTHHTEGLKSIFHEAHRVLRPGAWLSIAEVERGSAEDRWLDSFVARWNVDGHEGYFVNPGQMEQGLVEAGFGEVSETREEVAWRFPDRTSMSDFCKRLFGLVDCPPNEIAQALEKYFRIREATHGIELPWRLRYAIGRKVPGAPAPE